MYLVLGGVTLVAVIAVVIAVVIGTRDDGSSEAGAGAGTSATAGSSVAGTNEDWLSSVCAPGTFSDGANFPGAVGGGICTDLSRSDNVQFLQYDSAFKMRNDFAYTPTYCTGAFRDSGYRQVFMASSVSSLAPLSQFGFKSPVLCKAL